MATREQLLRRTKADLADMVLDLQAELDEPSAYGLVTANLVAGPIGAAIERRLRTEQPADQTKAALALTLARTLDGGDQQLASAGISKELRGVLAELFDSTAEPAESPLAKLFALPA